MTTTSDWSHTKDLLAELVIRFRAAYWETRRQSHATRLPNEPQALEVRALYFLVTLISGIMDALSALEVSVPTAVGCNCRKKSPLKGSGSAEMNGTADKEVKSVQNANDSQLEDKEGVNSESTSASSQERDAKEHTADPGEFRVKMEDGQCASTSTTNRFDFFLNLAKSASGVEAYLILKGVFWEAVNVNYCSWSDLKEVMQNRTVQYAFKVWLCLSTVLIAAIIIVSVHPIANDWKLYYSYITASAILIPHVEAALWKTVQRTFGTLLGGALAYLIMLRPVITSRHWAVLTLACASCFVITQFVHSAFRYSTYLTNLTLFTLTICQIPECCRPGSDFLAWKTRVVNIIVGATFAMAVSWLVLPYYASAEHLDLLAEAYSGAGKFIEEGYDLLYCNFKAAAQGGLQKKLDSDLETLVVAPVSAAVNGLRRDTVFWQKGLLSSPPIVEELSQQLRQLIHCCAALELAITQAPSQFGNLGPEVFREFMELLHEERKQNIIALVRVIQACQPSLKRGATAALIEKVEEAIAEAETSRAQLNIHFLELKHRSQKGNFVADAEARLGGMTAADSIKLSSYILAASKTYDQILLIAHTVICSDTLNRDTRWTSFFSLSGSQKND